MDLHQCLWIISYPLLEVPSLGKLLKCRKCWCGCNPIIYRFSICVHHIYKYGISRSLTGSRYHPIQHLHVSLHVLTANNHKPIGPGGPWMFLWLADARYLVITSRGYLLEGSVLWMAITLWDQSKRNGDRCTVMSSSMPYSSHSNLELIICFSWCVWSWLRRPAWASRLFCNAVHL